MARRHTSTRDHTWLVRMTIRDARRAGGARRAMPSHRSSVTTPPTIIPDRPQGRRSWAPGASNASTVAMATLFGVLLPDRRRLADQTYQPSVIAGTSTHYHKSLVRLTVRNARRPGGTRRAMLAHRSSGSTPPATIPGRPSGRRSRAPGALRASSVATATAFGTRRPATSASAIRRIRDL